jgi:PAS domain S-box-containing protein
MKNNVHFLKHLEYFSETIPLNIFWTDTTGKILGINQKILNSLKATNKSDIIGKTIFQIYPKDIAENLYKYIKKSITLNIEIKHEYEIKDSQTNSYKNFEETIAPLINNNKVIGIIFTSIDITEQKNIEQLKKLDNKKNTIKLENFEKFKKLINTFSILLNDLQNEIINEEFNIQIPDSEIVARPIKLTQREKQILFLLSKNKQPKEIALMLSKKQNKNLSPATIASVICKQLYIKFNVNTISNLLNKATKLSMIPLIPDDLF